MPRGIRNVPNVAPTATLEPMEQIIGQDVPRKMSSTGPASEALEPAHVQAVDKPVNGEKLANLAFMAEPVTIHIHDTSDPQAEQIFEIGNGGKRELFKRGETKTVQRKFVEVLLRAKITTFTQARRRGDDGVMYDMQVPHTSLRYPFSVVRDDHPRAKDWMQTMLRAG
jgi:hypothetical protein